MEIRSIKVRRAHSSDLPQLKEISATAASAAQWTQQQWLDIFHTEISRAPCLDCRRRNGPDQGPGIGFLVARNGGPEWELENIAVLPEFRRQGVGRALLSALLDEARVLQAERILLEVRASNQPAIRFYNSEGFQLLARRAAIIANPDGRCTHSGAFILIEFKFLLARLFPAVLAFTTPDFRLGGAEMNAPEREQLLASSEEFRKLAEAHSTYSQRLESLANKKYLSEEEKIEEIRLKKLKLRLKDEMESFRPRTPPIS